MRFKIERMGSDGEGIAYHKNKPVYIYYTYLGEEVEAELFINKRGAQEANLVEVIKPSPYRRDVTWPYYMKSGSVNLSHINYLEQLKYKRDVLNFLFVTNLKNETNKIKIDLTVPAISELNYRNKSYIPVVNVNNKNYMANYTRGSNQTFVVDELLTEAKIIEITAKQVLSLMDKHGFNAYNFRAKKGHILALDLRANQLGEVQLTFVLKKKVNLTNIVEEISKKYKHIVSIYENYVPDYRNSPDIYNGTLNLIGGNKYLEMEINNFKFYLTPFAFFQLNTNQAEKLYNIVIEKGSFKKDDLVLDAYSGVGTIATHISPYVKKVVAIESIKDAVNDMNYSLKVNKISNVKTITGDFVKLVSYLKEDFNKMIFNPPRVGLGEEVCNYIIKKEPKEVIYISCNPKTLVKDLKLLTKKYNINSITPFDMFPQTSQIETIVVLKLK